MEAIADPIVKALVGLSRSQQRAGEVFWTQCLYVASGWAAPCRAQDMEAQEDLTEKSVYHSIPWHCPMSHCPESLLSQSPQSGLQAEVRGHPDIYAMPEG